MEHKRILVVEDESVVALDLQWRLRRLGYEIAGVAATGDEAVRLAGETHPDLVLMDIHLRGAMDGVEAAERIRAKCRTPVVYLTAHADTETLQRAKVSEPYGYLVKPFDEHALHTTAEIALYKYAQDAKLNQLNAALRQEVAERERAEAALREHAERMHLLHEIDEAILAVRSSEAVARAALERVKQLAPCSQAFLALFNAADPDEVVFWEASNGMSPVPQATIDALRALLDQGRARTVDDVEVEPSISPASPILRARGVRSYIAVPLVYQGDLMGVLCLGSETLAAFPPKTITIAEEVARPLAVAIQHARLHARLQRHAIELELTVKARTADLQQEKDRVEAILNSSPDAIVLLGTEGAIQHSNPALADRFGYGGGGAIVGQMSTILVGPASHRAFTDAVREAGERGTGNRLEITAQRQDGTTFDADVAIAPVKEGQVVRSLVCCIRDISALKAVERMKDAFVSNVSHELRTPITNIKLSAELIRMNPLKRDAYLERLERETDRLHRIIEDLLQLSRLDQDRVTLRFTPTDLNALVEKVVTDRTQLAEGQGLALCFEGDQALPHLLADPGLLEQVLSILLTNACNYTPAGGQVMVRVWKQIREERLWVGFEVSDTGPGIAPEERSSLFRRFFRGSAALQAGVRGTGLGLALAKEIVARHQGRIEVSSEGVPGRGATFSVWLPALGTAIAEPYPLQKACPSANGSRGDRDREPRASSGAIQ